MNWRGAHSVFLSVIAVLGCVSCRTNPNDNPEPHGSPHVRAVSSTRPTTAPESLRAAMEFLASDELEGRGVGTAGLDRAADFIASRFYAAGLVPAPGIEDYFQSFTMTTGATIDSDKTFLKSGDAPALLLGKDYTPTSFAAEKSFANAPAVFVGYGISSPTRNHYDDYAGIDVKGKVAIAMRFEPHDPAGKSRFSKDSWSIDATLIEKARAAADHGAAALLLVNPPTYHGDADDLLPFARQFLGQTSSIPVFQVQRPIIEAALKRASQPDLKTLQAQIDDAMKPASRALGGDVNFSGSVALNRKTSNVKNVVAMLPGKGAHADEYVVVGAHYDHLGRGGPGAFGPRGEIYNGADDNASGTAAVLELADRLAEDGSQPRTIVFVAFTGEESGLVGSNHFVAEPPVPLRKIVAMLNLDMVGRMNADTLYVGGAGTAGNFEEILKAADAQLPVKIKEIGKGGIAPSDHMSFALRKIPVLFFFSGLHQDYHRPTDDVEKINFPGMVEVIDLGERVILALARMTQQEYVDAADASSLGSMMGVGTGGDGGVRRASLGVIPDYGSDTTTGGVRITGTMPKSPAAVAGLQGGDVIVQFGDRKIENLYDLSTALAGAKPGDKVHVAVMRDGKRIETDATLAERKPEVAG